MQQTAPLIGVSFARFRVPCVRSIGGGETYATNILTYAAARIFYTYIYIFVTVFAAVFVPWFRFLVGQSGCVCFVYR